MPQNLKAIRDEIGVDLPDDVLKRISRRVDTGLNDLTPVVQSPKPPAAAIPLLDDYRKELGGMDLPEELVQRIARRVDPDRFKDVPNFKPPEIKKPFYSTVKIEPIDVVSDTGKTIRNIFNPMSSGAAQFNASLARTPNLIYNLAAAPVNLTLKSLGYEQIADPALFEKQAKWWDDVSRKIDEGSDWNTKGKNAIQLAKEGDFGRAGKQLAYDVLKNFPQQAMFIGSAMAGAPLVGLTLAGTTSGAQELSEARAKGASQLRSVADAVLNGSIEAGFEKLGTFGILGRNMKNMAKVAGGDSVVKVAKEMARTLFSSLVGEGNEEYWTSWAQDWAKYVTGVDPNALKGAGGRANYAGLIGSVSGGLMSAPAAISYGVSSPNLTRVDNTVVDIEGLKKFMPGVANMIWGKDYPVNSGVVQGAVLAAAAEFNKSLKQGKSPQEADQAAMDAYLNHTKLMSDIELNVGKVVKGEPLNLVDAIASPEEENAPPETKAEIMRELDAPLISKTVTKPEGSKLKEGPFYRVVGREPNDGGNTGKADLEPRQAPGEGQGEELSGLVESLDLEPFELRYDQYKRVYGEGRPEGEIQSEYRKEVRAAVKAGKEVPDSIIDSLPTELREEPAKYGKNEGMGQEEGAGRSIPPEKAPQRPGAAFISAPAELTIKNNETLPLTKELLSNKAKITTEGKVVVYHRTSKENADKIRKTGEMSGKEDGLFFSTKPDGQSTGYGDTVIEFRIPLSDLQIDDAFGDEAHVKIPLNRPGQSIKVSDYFNQPAPAKPGGFNTNPAENGKLLKEGKPNEFTRKEVDVALPSREVSDPSGNRSGLRSPREVLASPFAVKYQKTGSLFIPNQKVSGPADLAFGFQFLKDEAVEHLLIGAMKNGRIVGVELVHVGLIDQVPARFFDMIHLLDRTEADGYFMVHNHPSGEVDPSSEDISMTRAAQQSLSESGYRLYGHVIIDDGKFGFIDPDTFAVHQYTHQEYAKTQEMPLLKKYLEWTKSKADLSKAPLITNPRSVFEFAKGIERGTDEGILYLMNLQNRILNAVILPKSHFTTGNIQTLAGRYRASSVVTFNSGLSPDQFTGVRHALTRFGIHVLDDVQMIGDRLVSQLESGGTFRENMPAYMAREKSLNDEYAKAKAYKGPGIKDTTNEFIREKNSSVKKFGKALGVVLSTRLKNIDPSLAHGVRQFEFNYRQAIKRDLERVRSFIDGLDRIAKANKTDALIMDLAMKNGDAGMVTQIARKYGVKDGLELTRTLLEDVRHRIKAVGYEVGYKPDYFPRKIRNRDGFLKYMEKQGKLWGEIDRAIKEKEASLNPTRPLNDDEKVNLINSFIRGFVRSKIALARTGNMQTREIEKITVELNRYYYTGRESLVRYLAEVNEAIEARKFFGRVEVKPNLDREAELALEEMSQEEKTQSALSFNNIHDSIGGFVNRLLEDGKISPDQQHDLKELFQARFGYIGTHGIMGLYKDVVYMDTISNPISALSNLDDLGICLYKAFWQTPGSFLRALANRSKITLDDLQLDAVSEEIREMSKSSLMLRSFLKASGFTFLDRVGKETYMNAVIDKYKAQAKRGEAGLEEKLVENFGPEADSVYEDLKEGRVSENVLFLAFNELSDQQPITLSEVPQAYLDSPGGRLFYTLKTFMVKRLNFIYDEIIGTPNVLLRERIKRFLKLYGLMVVFGAGVDELKDFILGRKTSWTDRLIDNLLKPFGLSKFFLYKVRGEGILAAIGQFISPPARVGVSIVKDIFLAGTPVKTGRKSTEPRMFEFPTSIPIGGKLWYWWFGRGAQKMRVQEALRHKRLRSGWSEEEVEEGKRDKNRKRKGSLWN